MAGLGFGFGNRSAEGDGRLIPASLEKVVDTDGDGVTDGDDQCPDEAVGRLADRERPGCPPADSDGDGIVDISDEYPDEPAGRLRDPARPGRPSIDSDGDGVADVDDQCPDTAADAVADPSRSGCPDQDDDQAPILFVDDRLVLDERVLFDFQKARVRSRARPVIAAIAATLEAHPEWTKVRIEGHADSRGPRGINRALSQRRANNVVRKLVEGGVDPNRLRGRLWLVPPRRSRY